MSIKKLEWDTKYSVGVLELDNQHKKMFVTINELLDLINSGNVSADKMKDIIESLVKYKIFHFETEESYFRKFNYSGAEEHIKKHQEFNEKLNGLKEQYSNNYSIEFAFALIDFLEDWLLDHLIGMDQKYKQCFMDNGLK